MNQSTYRSLAILLLFVTQLVQSQSLIIDLTPQEQHLYGLSPLPIYKVNSSNFFHYKNKKYRIKLPDSSYDNMGLSFIFYQGNDGSKIPGQLPVLVENYKGENPIFRIDLNNNLDFTDDLPRTFESRGVNETMFLTTSTISENTGNKFWFDIIKSDQRDIDITNYYTYKNEELTEPKYWPNLIVHNQVTGVVKLENDTFDIYLRDVYHRANYAEFDNLLRSKKIEESFYSYRSKVQDETVINLWDEFYFVTDIEPDGSRLMLTNAAKQDYIKYVKGDTIENYSFDLLNGQQSDLYSFLHADKLLALYFWGSWCKPCHELMPEMVDFYEKNKDQIEIIAFADDSKSAVEEYVSKNSITWPNVLPRKIHREIYHKLNSLGYPSFALIDQDGVIILTDGHFTQIAEAIK